MKTFEYWTNYQKVAELKKFEGGRVITYALILLVANRLTMALSSKQQDLTRLFFGGGGG